MKENYIKPILGIMTKPSNRKAGNVSLTFLLLLLGVATADELADDVEGSSSTISSIDELQNDLQFSHEDYTGEKEQEFDILVHLDDSLKDKYETILDECQFPDKSDSDYVENLINQTEEYVFLRRRWLEFFKSSPQNNPEAFRLDRSKLEIRVRQLKEAEYILQSIRVLGIWRQNSRMYSILSPVSLKWGRGFDFAEGENISETTAEYVKEFRSSLHDLKESMNVLEKQKVRGFPIVYCFNETIPPNYMGDAYQILERNHEVAPFYKTAVTYGKIVEPILLTLITIFGLVLNGTLIYIFTRHEEIGNSKDLMVLNLAVIGILRIIVELPLYYQQNYFSRHFLVDHSLLNAFRVFFISSSAFSILGLIIRQYISLWEPLYESPTTKRNYNIIYFLSVLISSLVIALISLLFVDKNDNPYVTNDILNFHAGFFVIFGMSLPVIMAIMNFLNVRRLIKDTREANGGANQQIEKMNRRGSRIAIALSIVYFVGCSPEIVRLIVGDYLDVYSNEYNIMYHFTDRALAYLFYSTVCMYPVALYIASGSYRRLFKLYLFRCLISKKQTTSTDIMQM